MKAYLASIRFTQNALLAVSIALLATLPWLLATVPWETSDAIMQWLYPASHVVLYFVMAIRPLADLLPTYPRVRLLVPLRKGAGVLSAAIIVSILLSKAIADPVGFLSSVGSLPYWALQKHAALAHLADVTAIVLLLTSNRFSIRTLGPAWKRIQRLSYVYFYASTLYVYLAFHDQVALAGTAVISTLTVVAYLNNRASREKNRPGASGVERTGYQEKVAAVAKPTVAMPSPMDPASAALVRS